MPGDLDYTHEKFTRSRDSLALGDEPMSERFIEAYLDQAMHALPLKGGSGPPISDELAHDLETFHHRVSSMPAAGNEGTLAATIHLMNEGELHDTVVKFLDPTSALDEEYYTHHARP